MSNYKNGNEDTQTPADKDDWEECHVCCATGIRDGQECEYCGGTGVPLLHPNVEQPREQ